MCKCLDELDNQIKPQGYRLDWRRIIKMDEPGKQMFRLPIAYTKNDQKSIPRFASLYCIYCPICGEKLESVWENE